MVGTSISKNLGVNKQGKTYDDGQRYSVINPSSIQKVDLYIYFVTNAPKNFDDVHYSLFEFLCHFEFFELFEVFVQISDNGVQKLYCIF